MINSYSERFCRRKNRRDRQPADGEASADGCTTNGLRGVAMGTAGNTDFAAVSAVCSLLSRLTVPYWIIGGWAIDLAVGR